MRSLIAVSEPSARERHTLTGVPISDVLELPPLKQARLVAGHDGRGRVVRSVNVMEVPDILDWVKPDELLLTTAYPLREDPAALEHLVPHLVAHGLAGMAIKPTRYIESIPARMIEDADRLGFPIVELPPPASFNEIIGAVLGVILDIQSVRLQRAAEIHDRFTWFRLGTLVANLAIVGYLVWSKRLFGIRGGAHAEHAIRMRDASLEAIAGAVAARRSGETQNPRGGGGSAR